MLSQWYLFLSHHSNQVTLLQWKYLQWNNPDFLSFAQIQSNIVDDVCNNFLKSIWQWCQYWTTYMCLLLQSWYDIAFFWYRCVFFFNIYILYSILYKTTLLNPYITFDAGPPIIYSSRTKKSTISTVEGLSVQK